MDDLKLNGWHRYLDVTFDVVTCVLSVIDIASDFAVLVSFWTNGFRVYFGISLAFLLITQIAYARLFTVMYQPPNYSHPYLLFFGALVLGQFVPIIMMLKTFDLAWLNWCFDRLGIRDEPVDSTVDSRDPLRIYLEKKVKSHGLLFVSLIGIVHFPTFTWTQVDFSSSLRSKQFLNRSCKWFILYHKTQFPR